MRKIALIGAGGINSHTAKYLSEMFKKLDIFEYLVVIYDKDIVEEKNILSGNQNFNEDDLMCEKAESLVKKYGFGFVNKFITEDNLNELDQYDDIILGVDNNKARQLVYKYCLTKNKYLLDLRAQGTQLGFYELDHDKDMEHYNKLHFSNPEVMERKGSCQLKQDIENNHIEMGNYIIACMGINACYLKHIRDEKIATKVWRFAY